nr:zf-CCHC domain-containing protein/DUF4219 domain-containing protein/UBN2 domain-containing protein [Tanacetum cinerariifolium]
MEVGTPYELLNDDQNKQLGKNNKANMTLYNALPRKEYERVFMCKPPRMFENDGVASKNIKEKIKSLALKAKVFREQTSDYSDNQGGSDEDEYLNEDEAKVEAFNLMDRNFCKFF